MKTLITGGSGMIGSALRNILPDALYIDSKYCDLRSSIHTEELFKSFSPDYVIHLAAKVGGVKANQNNLGEFYYDNILINTNVLESSKKCKVKKVVSLLSTCIYPDKVSYPLTEEQIHLGEPHHSNYGYAYAKRMLDVQSRAYRENHGCNFITAVPNNLYGEHDNFHLEDSHLIPAIIRKVYESKIYNSAVNLWGNGSPLREFTYSYDLAKILLFLLENYDDPSPINVGNTNEYSVREVCDKISKIFDFNGIINWDESKPTGQYKKPSSNSKLLKLGWKQEDYTNFDDGLNKVCNWFIENYPNIRGA
jgi:GDP-L-fucose synthase